MHLAFVCRSVCRYCRCNFDVYLHTHSVSHFIKHLLWPAWLCMTPVKRDVKLLYYVSTLCNIHIPAPFLWHTYTHPNASLPHTETYTTRGCVKWKDMTSVSSQMTVVIICLSSPHHLYLHHLPPIPGLHISVYKINTHTHMCTWIHVFIFTYSEKANVQQTQPNVHADTTDIHIHTRPPSSHRAKPSACLTLPLRMFWTSGCYAVFPVMWVCVSLCLICSLVSWGDRSWRRPSDWAVTNPLTTRLTVIGRDHTEGDGVSRW